MVTLYVDVLLPGLFKLMVRLPIRPKPIFSSFNYFLECTHAIVVVAFAVVVVAKTKRPCHHDTGFIRAF